MSESPTLMDARGAAKYLGISERGVHRLKAAGELPFIEIGRLIRYRSESLAAWAEAQERTENPATQSE